MAGNSIGDRLVRGWSWLDPVANVFEAIVGTFYRIPGTRWIKDLLHGTWLLRHPLHPAVTDVVVGAYTAVAVLDVVYLVQRDPGLFRATDVVMLAALLASLAAILSGLTDWHDTFGNERRLGILHGVLMTLISIGYLTSFSIRVSGGPRELAIYLGLGLWVALAVVAHLGGEMTYGYGTGVNRQAWTRIGSKWEALTVRADSLSDATPVEAKLKNGTPLFVGKVDGAVHVIANVCTHAGCSLSKGTLLGDRRHVKCPCHGSVFDVRTGSVSHGPATMNEPAFDARVSEDGALEVKLRA